MTTKTSAASRALGHELGEVAKYYVGEDDTIVTLRFPKLNHFWYHVVGLALTFSERIRAPWLSTVILRIGLLPADFLATPVIVRRQP